MLLFRPVAAGIPLAGNTAGALRAAHALLVDVEISSDSTTIKLSFSHYAVMVRGYQLDEIYHSIHAAECAVIMPGKRSDADAPHGSKPSMSVTDIRLKRLQPSS